MVNKGEDALGNKDENDLGNERDNVLGNEGDNALGNEGNNSDIHVDVTSSHHKMRDPTSLTVKGRNIYKMEIRTNPFGHAIGNNAKHFSFFLG